MKGIKNKHQKTGADSEETRAPGCTVNPSVVAQTLQAPHSQLSGGKVKWEATGDRGQVS